MESYKENQNLTGRARASQENLLSNTIIEFGSNMLVLNHPDVKGLHVKRDPTTDGVVVEIFVYRVSNSLKLLTQEEYGGHTVRFFETSLGPRIQASLS
jgi:hypothetical protein